MALVSYPEILPHTRDSNGDNAQTKYLQEYYSRLGLWLDSAFDEAVSYQQEVPEIKDITAALDYLGGMQWKENMPSYRAKPVSNEFLAMFWETIGLLTDVKPMFQVEDAGGSGDYSKVVDIENRLAKGWASNSHFERSLAFCTMFGMLTSAPAKIYWNPFAKGHSGDVSDGDISFEYCPVSSFLRLGEGGDDIQDDECVIYRKVRTLEWIKRAFPRMGPLVRPEEQRGKYSVDVQSPVTVSPQFYPTLSPGMRRLMGISEKNSIESVYPTAEVREFWMKDSTINSSANVIWMGPREAAWGYWVKPGQPLYPRGRVIVRSNSVTLYDEPNPYYHRKFPFALLGLYAVPWQKYAMSVVKPWMSQQDIMNQIMAGLLQCVKKAVNPPLLAARSAIHPEALRAIDSSKPGLKVSYSQNAPTPPSWQQPPNVPTYVLTAYGIVEKSMKQMSSGSAMDQAAGKKQVPGADTLDRITFSKSTPIRLMGRNLEDFVDTIGTMWVGESLQFHHAAHRMELLGPKGLTKEDCDANPGTLIPDGINSESFVRRFTLKCTKGTLLNVQRQDRTQICFALRKNKDLSRKKLYEQLDWNINLTENDAELAEEMKAQAKAMAAAGIQPGGHGGKK